MKQQLFHQIGAVALAQVILLLCFAQSRAQSIVQISEADFSALTPVADFSEMIPYTGYDTYSEEGYTFFATQCQLWYATDYCFQGYASTPCGSEIEIVATSEVQFYKAGFRVNPIQGLRIRVQLFSDTAGTHLIGEVLLSNQSSDPCWYAAVQSNAPFRRIEWGAANASGQLSGLTWVDDFRAEPAVVTGHTITATASAGGTISPNGAVNVPNGSSQTFTFLPDPSHRVTSVLVDGVEQGALTTYTFANVTTNHTIAATFVEEVSIPPPPGIVSWWSGDGDANDLIGTNNGTMHVGATFATGKVGQAFRFYEDSYFAATTAGLPIGNNQRTIELWVKIESWTSDVVGSAWFAGYGLVWSSEGQAYILGTYFSSKRLMFTQWGGGLLGPLLQTGQWYHIAVTNVGNYATLYLNGQQVAADATLINTPASSPFNLGRNPSDLDGHHARLDGFVDEVTVYNRALTANEIQAIYEAGSAGKIKPQAASTIVASASSGGTIVPNGSVVVPSGSNQTFTINPDPSYQVTSVLVDAVEQGAISTYTFTNVTSDHTIAATFMLIPTDVYVDATYTPGNAGGHIYGYDAFNAIQPGVAAVASGGTVHVAAGNYVGSISINNKSIILAGAGAATTIIGGGGGTSTCLTIAAPAVTVNGFSFTNALTGILVTGRHDTRITNCWVYGISGNGIALDRTIRCQLLGDSLGGNGGAGVYLFNARYNTISSCKFRDNARGVYITSQYNPRLGPTRSLLNTIQGNTFYDPREWSVYIETDQLSNKVNFNVFNTNGTRDKYIYNNSWSLKLNAQYNWFDGQQPPNPAGFRGNVDTSHSFATNATITVMTSNMLIRARDTVDISVVGLLPPGTYVKGSHVVLNWSNAAGIPPDSLPIAAAFFPSDSSMLISLSGASDVTVDQAYIGSGGIGNPLGGLPYVGALFTQRFLAGNSETTSQLSISEVSLRDPENSSIPTNVVDGYHLIIDATPPVVSGVTITNTSSDNNRFVKNADQLSVNATVTDNNSLTVHDITADLDGFFNGSGHSTDTAVTYASNTATWSTITSASCSPADGEMTVTVTATDLAGNSASAEDKIIADNTPPTKLTNVTAHPRNRKIRLNWTNGTDTYYRGATLRYNRWNDYPKYDAAAPAYPTTPLEGTAGALFEGVATGDWTIAPRDIYYISAFATDSAGNYSPVDADGQDRSTNYYLADMGSGPGLHIPGANGYDGRINFDDLIWFSNLYGKSESQWTYPTDAEADYAPTVANKTYAARHRFGVPRPDGRINFEDLMVFSMNYQNTVSKIQPPQDRQLGRELVVELLNSRSQTPQGEMLTVTVRLVSDGSEVKGASTDLTFDPSQLQFVDAVAGGVFGDSQQGFFYANAEHGKVRIDAAVLGADRTVNFSGNLAVVRFRVLQHGEGYATISEATVRTATNSEQHVATNNNAVELPTEFSLAQNYPNPFNPTTTIRFAVPTTSKVLLEVYNTLGQRLATLVNETREAGYYNELFDATSFASGVYFYRIEAGSFVATKKFVLLK